MLFSCLLLQAFLLVSISSQHLESSICFYIFSFCLNEIFHLSGHSPNAYNSQGWARPKPEAPRSFRSLLGEADPPRTCSSSCSLPQGWEEPGFKLSTPITIPRGHWPFCHTHPRARVPKFSFLDRFVLMNNLLSWRNYFIIHNTLCSEINPRCQCIHSELGLCIPSHHPTTWAFICEMSFCWEA